MAHRFTNPWPHQPHAIVDVLKWKLRLGPQENPSLPHAPNHPAPWQRLDPQRIASPPTSGWRAVWLGHASFLLQGCGSSLLVDPVFSNHCAPIPLPSLRRHVPPPCSISDLPDIDAILLTHSHYDHLDLRTLHQIGPFVRLLVAEGHRSWLIKRGLRDVVEIPWHQSVQLTGDIKITATPAQHFTARSLTDRDRAHWCGWRIDSPLGSLWHAGDTGYCTAFREIADRHGPVDFAMIPIGAYHPRRIMRPVHLNPDEAVQAFLDARCRRACGMHWGTFRLTDEPLGEPPLWLHQALNRAGLNPESFIPGIIGDIMKITHKPTS